MRCENCRDAISARLDGEDPGVAPEAIDQHLEGCAACRAFSDRAAHVTRMTRIRPAENHPDVLPGLLAALDAGESRPAPRRDRRRVARDAVRAALAVLSVGQLALGLSGIAAALSTPIGPDQVAGASMTHFSHETAAWNLALGVAFGWAASGAARRTGGLVPTIAAFVAPLLALSAVDLFAGDVTAGRLLGHLPVVAGLVLLLLHARLGRDGGGTRVTAHDDGATAHDGATGTGHGNSGFGGRRFGDGGLQPSAHHRAA